jgi:hypothetical protein
MRHGKRTAPVRATLATAALSETFAGALISEREYTQHALKGNSQTSDTADVETLKAKAALADELTAILEASHWTPTERVTLGVLRVAAQGDAGAWREVNAPATQLAERIGISDKTTRDTLTKFERIGIVSRHTERRAVNKFGDEIPAQAVNLRNGDRWIADTTIALAAKLPDRLPALNESANQKRTREVNQARRREFAELKTKLDNLLAGVACPHCGDVGQLHGEISATCGACGTHLDAGELSELIDGEAMPTETEIISAPSDEAKAGRRRALRNLAGTDTPPAPGIDYRHDQDAGINVELPARKSFPHIFSDAEIISPPSGALRDRTPVDVWIPDTLTGAATVEYLAGLGAAFSLVKHGTKEGVNPRSDDGFDELNYLDCPMTAAAAAAHLQRRGSVGVLGDHCQMAIVDVDAGAAEFIAAHGALAMGARITRDNAPDRVKLVVYCPDVADAEKSIKLESADGTRKIEVIGKRKHAIVAGTHESGATIKCETAYSMPLFTWAQLVTIAQQWTGQNEQPAHSLSAQRVTTAQAAGTISDVQSRIIKWQQEHERECLAMLGNPKEGAYVKLRSERTPSARVTRHDGRIVLIDYGNNNEHIDLFDVFIGEKGIDKRVAIGRLMNGRDIETGKLEAAR